MRNAKDDKMRNEDEDEKMNMKKCKEGVSKSMTHPLFYFSFLISHF